MTEQIMLTVFCFFGSLALTINAFFLRGIFQDLNEVKITLAEIIQRSKAKSEKIAELEKKIQDHENSIHNIEIKLGILEEKK